MTKEKTTLKPAYVKRLYTQLRMEKNLLTEREWLAIKHTCLTPVPKAELEKMFEEPASQVREVARRAAMRLHVEAQNIKWRNQMSESHVKTMLCDTMEELRTLSKDMNKWQDAIQQYSWKVDALQSHLRKAWDYWMMGSKDALALEAEPKEERDDEVYITWICSRCARDMGGTMPEGYVCTWHPDTCCVCDKFIACTEPTDFRLCRDGTPMKREPTLEEVD